MLESSRWSVRSVLVLSMWIKILSLQKADIVHKPCCRFMMLGSSYNLLGTIDAPTKSVNALAFSTNGRYLASGSDDMIVRVYDITNQFSVIWQHKGRSPFTAIVWREDSLITGTGDGEVSLFYPITVSSCKDGLMM